MPETLKVEVEGLTLEVIRVKYDWMGIEGEILQTGDTYIAKRNGPWQILTCRKLSDDGTFVIPQEKAYCFDTYECYKVISFGETLVHSA
jgi:hypothetical protein